MRLLYLTRDYTPHDFRFLSALSESEHQVFSLRLENRGRKLEQRPLPSGIQSIDWCGGKHPVHWWNYPALLFDLRRVIRSLKPDLIHAGPIQSTAFLAAMSGFKPLVSMSWGSDMLVDASSTPWMRLTTRYTMKKTSVFLCDCLAVQQAACSFGFPADRINIFPWGVDIEHFSPGDGKNLRQKLNWEDDFVLLSLRTWEPIYGVDVIVKAFVLAAPQIPQLKLFLLGSGSQETYLRNILAEHHLLERVHFGGRVENTDLPEYYRAADLYLSASHSDGSSVSLMESLACSCPVLVSDIPGNKEWIVNELQGWLFPDSDEQALAAAMINAFNNRSLLKSMKLKARSLAEQRADWSENVKKLFHAYDQALMKNR